MVTTFPDEIVRLHLCPSTRDAGRSTRTSHTQSSVNSMHPSMGCQVNARTADDPPHQPPVSDVMLPEQLLLTVLRFVVGRVEIRDGPRLLFQPH